MQPLHALLYVLLAYVVMQVALNLLVRNLAQRSSDRAMTALKGSFWAGVVNALFFIAASYWLHMAGIAPNRGPDANTKWWALAGVPLGVVLWYLSAKARTLGIQLFGATNLISGEDAILRAAPSPGYINWGIANQTFIQPLGRELFLRGAFLPLVIANLGWGWALPVTLVVELAPRLNVVWLPLVLLHGLSMCGLFYLSGSALCGLVASCVSGCLHSMALAYITVRGEREPTEEQVLGNAGRKPPRRKRPD